MMCCATVVWVALETVVSEPVIECQEKQGADCGFCEAAGEELSP